MIIENDCQAKNILFSINYYVFSGYLFDFKNNDGKYRDITFDKIYNIYQCDKRLKSIILYAIEIIEHNLKTKISYFMATALNPLAYTDSRYFVNENEHKKMLSHFERNVNQNNRIPFVKHHIIKYDGNFPIWVAIELFTFGMIWNLYKNLQRSYKKGIATYFNTGVIQLESWIECVSYLRNLSAHNMRLYNFNIQKTPKKGKKNFSDFIHSYKVYDILYVMQFLVPDKSEWNNYILQNIEDLLNEYSEYIDISCYGFKQNWRTTLTKK